MKPKLYTLAAMIFLAGLVIRQNASATVHQVDVANFSFSPSSLNVLVGDTVTWVWVSGSHTTTSTSVPAGAASWDHPINSTNTSFSYKVTVTGTFNYKCTPHFSMGMVGSFTATSSSVGVVEQNAEAFLIYPNPVAGKINIASESLKTSSEEVSVYNINSQRVLGPINITGSPASVDLGALAEGVYFLRIGKNNSGKVERIIKIQ